MKRIRNLFLALAIFAPAAAIAGPTVVAACPMGCCADGHCPMHCPYCNH